MLRQIAQPKTYFIINDKGETILEIQGSSTSSLSTDHVSIHANSKNSKGDNIEIMVAMIPKHMLIEIKQNEI